MTDQHIWDHFYMTKPVESGNWCPAEADKDLTDWAETVISVLHALIILLAMLFLGALVWIAA